MRDKRMMTVGLLVLSLAALAILLGQALASPTTAIEARLPGAAQPVSPAEVPRSCWLGPGTALPWPYGTSSASLRLAYNAQAKEFLALTFQEFTDWELQTPVGVRLSTTGQPLGAPVPLLPHGAARRLTTLPALAYSPASDRYLVVWSSTLTTGDKAVGSLLDAQLLAADLSSVKELPLNTTHGHWPAVAYNPDDDEFLVVWQDERQVPSPTPTPYPTDTTPTVTLTPTPRPTEAPTPTPAPVFQGIYAQRVRGDGTRVGPAVIPVHVAASEETVTTPQVVYNAQEQAYLVVWVQSAPQPGLYGRRLDRNGQPLGDVIPLVTAPFVPYRPLLAYNPAANQYLLVWAEAREVESRLADVYGRLLAGQGEPLGEPFLIRGTAKQEVPTALVYNPVHEEYLVAWDVNQEGEQRPSLQRLSAQGEPLEAPIETAGAVFGLGVAPEQGHYLVLEGIGARARPLGFEPDCPEVSTMAAEATPTPWPDLPLVVQQWEGVIREIQPAAFDATQWLVEDGAGERHQVFVTRLTRVDAHLGDGVVGARVWVTAHEIDVSWSVADEVAVVARPATPAAQVYLPLVRRDPPVLPDLVGAIQVALAGFNGRCVPDLSGPVELRGVNVGNVGTVPAGVFTVRTTDAGGVGCTEWRLEGLAPRQWLSLSVPEGLSCVCPCAGKIDADDEVRESNEANNLMYSPTLTPPATCTPAPTATPAATPAAARR